MRARGRWTGWVAGATVALLMMVVAVPALTGAANAAPISGAVTSPSAPQWAYGGEGWSNNTLLVGNTTISWNASFGWSVVFTMTSANGTTMLEEQRTAAVTIKAQATSPLASMSYQFHAQQVAAAFANLTNSSVVYVGGVAVPALGLINTSASVQEELRQAIQVTASGSTRSASFDAAGSANASVSFQPSLGLVPLNLTNVAMWNSSAMATPSANWSLSWNWVDQGFNGTSGSGSGSKSGNLTLTVPVNLTGYKLLVTRAFPDHLPRVGILLLLQGPFDSYDGFILVPRAFDVFGSANHAYNSVALGSSGISAEKLYLSPGPRGPEVTAADTSFTSGSTAVSTMATPISGPTPAATWSPGTTVLGDPMSVAQAGTLASGLTQTGASLSGSLSTRGALFIGLVVAAVAVALGAFGIVEWRVRARRRQARPPVATYNPPGAAAPSAPQGSTPAGEPASAAREPK